LNRKHYFLQDPPRSFLLKSRLALWPGVAAVRRLRRPLQADIHLLSYPKTGRTWVRVMMGRMLAEHFGHPELAQVELGPRMPKFAGVPHVLAKHDGTPQKKTAAEINPDRSEYARCRVILLVRDLRDTAVSNYFQVTRRAVRFDGDIATYLRWPRGSVDGMIRYYNAWAGQRKVPKGFLLVRYEDLQDDAPRELRRVAAFLGLHDVSVAALAEAVEYASFRAMKQREAQRPADASVLAPGRAGDAESFKTRKGKIGGYAEYLSAADIDWLNRRIDAELDPYYGYSSAPAPGPVRD
jgi:hypothetical protein